MRLGNQRRIAADLLKVGRNRVWFNTENLEDIKKAITKDDIRELIKDNIVQAKPEVSNSRSRARKQLEQKRKGRRQGAGSRKGSRRARLPRKEEWMIKIRNQRNFIKELKIKNLIDVRTYRNLYRKTKGGFFRSKRHIKLYLNEHKLFVEKKK